MSLEDGKTNNLPDLLTDITVAETMVVNNSELADLKKILQRKICMRNKILRAYDKETVRLYQVLKNEEMIRGK